MKAFRTFSFIVAFTLLLPVAGSLSCAGQTTNLSGTQTGSYTAPTATSLTTTTISNAASPVSVIATNLDIPWEMVFLPDAGILFTERLGRIRNIDNAGNLSPEPLFTVSQVVARGEGGLLGLALHPDYSQNKFVYIYHTYQDNGGLANRVIRYRFDGRSFSDMKVIIDGIPASSIHNGGRIKFGPDKCLYITCGDASDSGLAQDLNSLAGKILRVNDDGSVPGDNPFPGSPVYSYGHRNPEGLAWDARGRLWETEHGSSAHDEVNLIQPGKNYGWPVIQGDQQTIGMETPVINSGNDTWAPSGCTIIGDLLYFAGLRGESLFVMPLDSPSGLRHYFQNTYGRLRNVVTGPDGFLYVFTNNTDGRGSPLPSDDRLLRIDPSGL